MHFSSAVTVLTLSLVYGTQTKAQTLDQESQTELFKVAQEWSSTTDEVHEKTSVQYSEPSLVQPDDVHPTTLQELEPDGQGEGFQLPPPIFDPWEPRPNGIFVTSEGAVRDELPKPPPISLIRPEILSKFDGAHVDPEHNPYPPDEMEYGQSQALYPCRGWWKTFRTSVCMLALFSAAVSLVLISERLVVRLRRRSRSCSSSQSSGILVPTSFPDDKRARSYSGGTRPTLWTRSPSPQKLNLV